MASLRTFFHPVKDETKYPAPVRVKPKPVPTAPVTAEAYVSPLQTELRAIQELRHRVCNHLCTGCKYSTGNTCALDQRLDTALTDREDPAPYLADLQGNIKALEEATNRARKTYEDAKKWQQPVNRLRLGIYTAMGTGMVTAAITVAKLMFGIP